MHDKYAVCLSARIGMIPIKYFSNREAALDFEKILEASAILNRRRRKDRYVVVCFCGSEVSD